MKLLIFCADILPSFLPSFHFFFAKIPQMYLQNTCDKYVEWQRDTLQFRNKLYYPK